jgi:hypothetical protein
MKLVYTTSFSRLILLRQKNARLQSTLLLSVNKGSLIQVIFVKGFLELCSPRLLEILIVMCTMCSRNEDVPIAISDFIVFFTDAAASIESVDQSASTAAAKKERRSEFEVRRTERK